MIFTNSPFAYSFFYIPTFFKHMLRCYIKFKYTGVDSYNIKFIKSPFGY